MSGTDPWRDAGSEPRGSDRPGGDGWTTPPGAQPPGGWATRGASNSRDSWTPNDDWSRTGPIPTAPGTGPHPADRGSLFSPVDPATGGILRPRYTPRPAAQNDAGDESFDLTYAGWPEDELTDDDQDDLVDDDDEDDDDYDTDGYEDDEDEEQDDYAADGYADGEQDASYDGPAAGFEGPDFEGPDDGFDGPDDGFDEDDQDDDVVVARAAGASRFGDGRRPAARRWPQNAAPAGGRPAAGGRTAAAARASKSRIGRGPRILIIAVVVVLVVGVTYWTMAGGSHTTSTAPPAPLPTAKPVPADFLDSAFTDTDPVSENEFFRDGSVVAGAHTYTRVARKLDQGCPDLTGIVALALAGQAPMPTAAPAPSAGPSAAAGAAPAAAATPAAPVTPGPLCRQLVRALYIGEPDKAGRRLLAGVNVIVVDSATTAKNAVQALGAGSGGVTPLPLPANALPGAKISSPNADNDWRTAFSDGHYAVLVQLAYSDGTKGKATDPVLVDGATDLKKITTSPLDDRSVLGRGYRG